MGGPAPWTRAMDWRREEAGMRIAEKETENRETDAKNSQRSICFALSLDVKGQYQPE